MGDSLMEALPSGSTCFKDDGLGGVTSELLLAHTMLPCSREAYRVYDAKCHCREYYPFHILPIISIQ
jgi:hypothetical protein